jgi:flagellar protein FliO/FliZ
MSPRIGSIACVIGLALLGMWPVGAFAQVGSATGATSPAPEVTPASYQQPASAQESGDSPIALKPQAAKSRDEHGKSSGGLQSLVTVGGSLAVVLGIFFAVVWLLRRASPGAVGVLPAEAFEVLGRAPLAQHQQVHLLRCGTRLLLVSVSATGAETLSEITDREEVEHLTGLCQRARSASRPATALRRILQSSEDRHA